MRELAGTAAARTASKSFHHRESAIRQKRTKLPPANVAARSPCLHVQAKEALLGFCAHMLEARYPRFARGGNSALT